MSLPHPLREAVNAELNGIPAPRLARATEELVARYRAGRANAGSGYILSDDDVAAYAAYRMPATYIAQRGA